MLARDSERQGTDISRCLTKHVTIALQINLAIGQVNYGGGGGGGIYSQYMNRGRNQQDNNYVAPLPYLFFTNDFFIKHFLLYYYY